MQKKNSATKGLSDHRTRKPRRKASPHRLLLLALAGASLLSAPQALAGSFGGGAVTVNEGVLNSLGSGQAPAAIGYSGSYGGNSVAMAPAYSAGAPRGAGSSSVSPYQLFPTQQGSVVLPSYPLLFPPKTNPRSVAVAPQGSPAPAGSLSQPMASPPTSQSMTSGNSQQQPESQFIPPTPNVASNTTPAAEPAKQMASDNQAPKPVTLPAKPEIKKAPEEPMKVAAKTETKAVEEDPAGNSLSAVESPTPPPPPPAIKQPSSTPQVTEAPEPPKAEAEPAAKPEMKKAEPVQVAATDPSQSAAQANLVTLLFDPSGADLTSDAEKQLDTVVADMKADSDLRIQLLAYAGGDDLSVNRARRLSLNRALKVRAYLLKQDIRSTRMDVRALGKTDDGGSLNRVDIRPARR